jgi:TP901 family phage tail tape measure protein
MSTAVLQLAPSTQQGPMQLAEALYHLKSVGLDNAQAMMALKTASDLAAVGGSNLEETTNAIAAAWRSGIKGAQNFTAAASTVNAIIGAGNMRMQDFVAAMSTGVLSAATTFGVSLKQVGGAMALLTDEGVPAQVAAHRLRMSLSLLGAASPTAAKQLKTIGLTSYQLGQALRTGGFIGAIGLLRQHLKGAGLDATQTAALLSHAFGGGQSSSAILTLINNFSTLKKKQDQIDKGMSKYGSDVKAQRQTVGAQLGILKSNLETAGIRLGQALLPPFTHLVKFIASDLLPAAIRLGGVLGRLFNNPLVEAFAGGLAAALLVIKGIGIATKLWEGAQLLLDAALSANPIGIAIVAVAALAAGIAILWERSSTFRKIVEGAFHAVEKAAKHVWNWIKGHWELLLAILTGPIGLAVLFIKDHWKQITHAVSRVWNWIKGHWPLLLAILTGPIGLAVLFLKDHWKTIRHDISSLISDVTGFFRRGVDHIVGLVKGWYHDMISWVQRIETDVGHWFEHMWDNLYNFGKRGVQHIVALVKGWYHDFMTWVGRIKADVVKWIKKMWDDLYNFGKRGIDHIVGLVEGWYHDFMNWVYRIKEDVIHWFEKMWGNLVSDAQRGKNDVLNWFHRMGDDILKFLGHLAGDVFNAGKNIIRFLAHGISSAIGDVTHAIGGVVGKIKSFLPFSPAKEGPLSGSGDPHYSGLSIGKKLAAGITASLPAIKAAVGGTVGEINSAMAKAAVEKASGTTSLSSLTSRKDQLQALRAKEEASIKKLIAAREQEYKEYGKASKAERKAQEDEIKELEKLRAKQETQVKQTEAVISTLKKSMTQLKDEVNKLKEALKKANEAAAKAAKAAASSSTSSSSSSSSSSSGAQPTDFANFNQWLAETGPNPADSGSWQGNPGLLGGFGLAFNPGAGPGPVGGFDGAPPLAQAGSDLVAVLLADKLDEVIGTLRAQPGKFAAANAAALNGVSQTSITRGNW